MQQNIYKKGQMINFAGLNETIKTQINSKASNSKNTNGMKEDQE